MSYNSVSDRFSYDGSRKRKVRKEEKKRRRVSDYNSGRLFVCNFFKNGSFFFLVFFIAVIRRPITGLNYVVDVCTLHTKYTSCIFWPCHAGRSEYLSHPLTSPKAKEEFIDFQIFKKALYSYRGGSIRAD